MQYLCMGVVIARNSKQEAREQGNKEGSRDTEKNIECVLYELNKKFPFTKRIHWYLTHLNCKF